jgi:hypothetical protein
VGNLWSSRELMRKHAEMTLRTLMDHRCTDGSRIRSAWTALHDSGAFSCTVTLTTDPVEIDPDNPDEVGAVE